MVSLFTPAQICAASLNSFHSRKHTIHTSTLAEGSNASKLWEGVESEKLEGVCGGYLINPLHGCQNVLNT
jgi:hypothetical protein